MSTLFKQVLIMLVIVLPVSVMSQGTSPILRNDSVLRLADQILHDREHSRDSIVKHKMKYIHNSAELSELRDNSFISQTNDYAKYLRLTNLLKQKGTNPSSAFDNYLRSLEDTVNVKTKLRHSKLNVVKQTKYIKVFDARQIENFSINNQFGNVLVNTWPGNTIKVEITVRGYSSSDALASAALAKVHINSISNDHTAGLNTTYDKLEYWTGVQTNYMVYVPEALALDIVNVYGDVNLTAQNGPIHVKTTYGDVLADNLINTSNSINTTYGAVIVRNKFAGTLTLSNGSANLSNIGKTHITAEYSPISIGKISAESSIDMKFGKELSIAKVSEDVSRIDINAAFLNITFGPDPATNFDFELIGASGYRNRGKVTQISSKKTKANNYLYTTRGRYGKESHTMVVVRQSDCVLDFR